MNGNEFRFFLSCDINLPVTFKIERLEGKLPQSPTQSGEILLKFSYVVWTSIIVTDALWN